MILKSFSRSGIHTFTWCCHRITWSVTAHVRHFVSGVNHTDDLLQVIDRSHWTDHREHYRQQEVTFALQTIDSMIYTKHRALLATWRYTTMLHLFYGKLMEYFIAISMHHICNFQWPNIFTFSVWNNSWVE